MKLRILILSLLCALQAGAAQNVINIGDRDNDPNADRIRVAFNKTNKNFTELYTRPVITTATKGLTLANGTISITAGTTKGDVLVYNGTTWTAIAAGTNGNVLTADSAQTLGVKWASAGGSVPTTLTSMVAIRGATGLTISGGPAGGGSAQYILNSDGSHSFERTGVGTLLNIGSTFATFYKDILIDQNASLVLGNQVALHSSGADELSIYKGDWSGLGKIAVASLTTTGSPHFGGTVFLSGVQFGDNSLAGDVRGFISADSDGVFRWGDSNGGGSPRVILGSADAANGIAFQRNNTTFEIRKGDNSAYGDLRAADITAATFTGSGAGLTNLPITVLTGALVYVDAVNGNNSTALRGRLDKPFATLTAAQTAAQAGDTVTVFPGTYAERLGTSLKNGVNWYFMPGAKVNYAAAFPRITTDVAAVGAAVINDDAGAVTAKIMGYGEFTVTATRATGFATSAYLFAMRQPTSNITFECLSLTGATPDNNVDDVAVRHIAGTLNLRCLGTISSNRYDAVWCGDFNDSATATGDVKISAREIVGSNQAVEIGNSDATIYVEAVNIHTRGTRNGVNPGDSAIVVGGDHGSYFWNVQIRCARVQNDFSVESGVLDLQSPGSFQLDCSSIRGTIYAGGISGSTFEIVGATINSGTSACITLEGSVARLTLRNCRLITSAMNSVVTAGDSESLAVSNTTATTPAAGNVTVVKEDPL